MNRPGTRHTVFTVENENGKARAQMEMKNTIHRKKAATRQHSEMYFKATTEKTQSMRRALLLLTAFYKKECVDYVILF